VNEYLNPWYILAETGTRRYVIMMPYGHGDKPNGPGVVAMRWKFLRAQTPQSLCTHCVQSRSY